MGSCPSTLSVYDPMPATNLHLPHLVSFCEAFELRTNRHCRSVTAAAKKWVSNSHFLALDERQAIPGLQPGLLAALCYPTCDVAQLLLITQLMIVVVHCMDNPHDSDSVQSTLDQIMRGLSRSTTLSWQQRFQRHLVSFQSAQARVTLDNEHAVVPDLESYVALRGDSSGIRMLFDLIEFSEGLQIPDHIYASPELQHLRRDACNIVCWSSDIAEYVRKHAGSDKHNLVVVLCRERDIQVQAAIHTAGSLVKETVAAFLANERLLLEESYGTADCDVRRYARGLRDWIVGFTHWLYETDRYFGDAGSDVRELGWVFLPSD